MPQTLELVHVVYWQIHFQDDSRLFVSRLLLTVTKWLDKALIQKNEILLFVLGILEMDRRGRVGGAGAERTSEFYRWSRKWQIAGGGGQTVPSAVPFPTYPLWQSGSQGRACIGISRSHRTAHWTAQ